MRGMTSFFITVLVSLTVHAAKINTQCTKDATTGVVEGVNVQTPFTIASVSKVFTTHWGIAEMGANYRYTTTVLITPVGQDLYDVHLQGSMFPYFDRTMYQFLIGELNKLNVKKIHYLTYDEDFIYSSNMRINPSLAHGNDEQTTIETMKDLRQDTTTINKDLTPLNAKALALEKMVLPKTLTLSISDIHFVSKRDFTPTALTKGFTLKSSELFRTLKEMNRNSHNYAAENIYRKLARAEDYDRFLQKELPGVPVSEIILYNGSGYPVTTDTAKLYNAASCRAVVEMMANLRQHMITNGLEFKDIVPVAGKDASDGESTVTQIYGNDKTNGVLMGKTGSVADTIALAGMVSTNEHTTYFHTSFDVERTAADREAAYKRIKDWVMNDLIGSDKKGDLNSYVPRSFLPFDSTSVLAPVTIIRKMH